ncbi:Transcriptional regulator of RNA polII, SAGA, subunit family protein [Candida parapsilosis]|uniref:Transcriptional coactivator HFI1/ADA1 n=2 Tax=Candida parapsilosis TaxID=5480 RepID=G8B767_CANPC|nr:uncharacterized protein CPAR2_103380 [Candida parapsilosis]KAF6048278.1 Transcriptional regulator of RNA polII, SAGA, subunit family protein [Candida parapsilosis]KAF6049756.1 Transcriptional regulator of RNA polII, SAGA, subunit family protein [Candida parapsilosis]KAF6057618.1 Transcriptional regulator of RNA polII, SAGA, subunit family protein [Candida parapsilosis]KAF6065674.1 Transcriptional regulator of RNA polII, SAGA, subunit family protein [Candida parapsilosis]CCE40300.1 hypotheti
MSTQVATATTTTATSVSNATATSNGGSGSPANISPQQQQQQQSSSQSQSHHKAKSGKRIELERLIREFQSKLGPNWEKYHEALSLFLIGKLSRPELVSTITPLLKPQNLFRYHNKLLMLNFANSLKDGPLDAPNELALFWNKKFSKVNKNVRSTQYEKFKQNIMGLPIKERRRIKNITRDSGKRNKLTAGITLTRHTLLPKIPMIQDKEKQQLQVNNLVQWQQDVLNGINAPIATENYEIPDADTLSKQILMTMREHGLTGGLNPGVIEVLLLGLKSHLKNIVESAIDVAKYRKNKYTNNDYVPLENGDVNGIANGSSSKPHSFTDSSQNKDIVLSVEDMYDTFEMFPHIIEPCGPKMRLSNVLLENDDAQGKSLNYELPPKPASYLEEQKKFTQTTTATTATTAPIASNRTSAIAANGSNCTPVSSAGAATITDPTTAQSQSSSNDGKADESVEGKRSEQQQQQQQHHQQQPQQPQQQPLPRPDAHIGTTDELKWVLHDLISTM